MVVPINNISDKGSTIKFTPLFWIEYIFLCASSIFLYSSNDICLRL